VPKRMLGLSTGWLTVALVVASVGAIGFITLAGAIGTGFWSFFFSGVGSALLSTALALLISEIVLKPLLVHDLLSMTQLRDRIADISMRDLGPASRVRWEELYATSGKIDLVVDSPAGWVDRDLERVIACSARNCQVRVFLPPSTGDIEKQVADAELKLRQGWTRRQEKDKRAALEVWFLNEIPTSFMGRFDDEVVVAMDAGLPDEAKQKIYLHVGSKGSSDVQTWINDRWQWTDSDIGKVAWVSPKSPPDPDAVRKGLGTKLDDAEGAL